MLLKLGMCDVGGKEDIRARRIYENLSFVCK